MKHEILPNKLMGDDVYSIRSWFHSPFKGGKYGLPRIKVHWNFVQSSTRMAIKKSFSISKRR
jgi:hypothetical protein